MSEEKVCKGVINDEIMKIKQWEATGSTKKVYKKVRRPLKCKEIIELCDFLYKVWFVLFGF